MTLIDLAKEHRIYAETAAAYARGNRIITASDVAYAAKTLAQAIAIYNAEAEADNDNDFDVTPIVRDLRNTAEKMRGAL